MTYEVIRERWKHLEPDEIEKKVEQKQEYEKLRYQRRKEMKIQYKHIGRRSVRNRCKCCYERWSSGSGRLSNRTCPFCNKELIMAEREGNTRWWELKNPDKLEIMKNQEPQLLVIK